MSLPRSRTDQLYFQLNKFLNFSIKALIMCSRPKIKKFTKSEVAFERLVYLYPFIIYFLFLPLFNYIFSLLDTVYRVGHCGKMTRAYPYLSIVRMDG